MITFVISSYLHVYSSQDDAQLSNNIFIVFIVAASRKRNTSEVKNATAFAIAFAIAIVALRMRTRGATFRLNTRKRIEGEVFCLGDDLFEIVAYDVGSHSYDCQRYSPAGGYFKPSAFARIAVDVADGCLLAIVRTAETHMEFIHPWILQCGNRHVRRVLTTRHIPRPRGSATAELFGFYFNVEAGLRHAIRLGESSRKGTRVRIATGQRAAAEFVQLLGSGDAVVHPRFLRPASRPLGKKPRKLAGFPAKRWSFAASGNDWDAPMPVFDGIFGRNARTRRFPTKDRFAMCYDISIIYVEDILTFDFIIFWNTYTTLIQIGVGARVVMIND